MLSFQMTMPKMLLNLTNTHAYLCQQYVLERYSGSTFHSIRRDFNKPPLFMEINQTPATLQKMSARNRVCIIEHAINLVVPKQRHCRLKTLPEAVYVLVFIYSCVWMNVWEAVQSGWILIFWLLRKPAFVTLIFGYRCDDRLKRI